MQEVIYRLPGWAETEVVVCLGVAMAGLAVYMVFAALNNIINASLKLESIRHKKETEALNGWQRAYDEEHALHMQDISDLSAQLVNLEKELSKATNENERIKARLSKLRVIDLAMEADDV